jgi:hypothetical protein
MAQAVDTQVNAMPARDKYQAFQCGMHALFILFPSLDSIHWKSRTT